MGTSNCRSAGVGVGGPDVTVGLFYYRLRYYDPVAGRFVSRDPLGLWGDPGQRGNGQSYCGANPANFVDPLGLRRDQSPTSPLAELYKALWFHRQTLLQAEILIREGILPCDGTTKSELENASIALGGVLHDLKKQVFGTSHALQRDHIVEETLIGGAVMGALVKGLVGPLGRFGRWVFSGPKPKPPTPSITPMPKAPIPRPPVSVTAATESASGHLVTKGNGFSYMTGEIGQTATGAIRVGETGTTPMIVAPGLREQGIGSEIVRVHLAHWQGVANATGREVIVEVTPVTQAGLRLAAHAGFETNGVGKLATIALKPGGH